MRFHRIPAKIINTQIRAATRIKKTPRNETKQNHKQNGKSRQPHWLHSNTTMVFSIINIHFNSNVVQFSSNYKSFVNGTSSERQRWVSKLIFAKLFEKYNRLVFSMNDWDLLFWLARIMAFRDEYFASFFILCCVALCCAPLDSISDFNNENAFAHARTHTRWMQPI